MNIELLDFKKSAGLIPCVVQDAQTSVVLMLGFMNEEALQKTLAEKSGFEVAASTTFPLI